MKIFNADTYIDTYALSVSEGCVERPRVRVEQVLDVCQTFDLELLRLFLYDLSNESGTKKGL